MSLFILLASTHILPLSAQFCADERFTSTSYFTDDAVDLEVFVQYGVADEWFMELPQPALNTFDIAFPDTAADPLKKRPLIVLAHGGGFWGGEKEDMRYHIETLAKAGYVAVSVNYRKGWDGSPYDCLGDSASLQRAIYFGIQDVHAALRYIVANASRWNIDTSAIFVGGESAGSYAMMNAVYLAQDEWNADHAYFEAMYGPIHENTNNIIQQFDVKGCINMWGGVYGLEIIQPEDARPTIGFYGALDDVIPPVSGTIQNCPEYEKVLGTAGLSAYLNTLGICTELHANPYQGHEAYEVEYTVNNIACFIKRLLCDDCTTVEYSYSEAACSADYIQTTGISEEKTGNVLLYPNPATAFITIAAEKMEHVEGIYCYNVSGALIPLVWNIRGNTAEADVSHLPTGIYSWMLLQDGVPTTGYFSIVR